MVCFYCDRCGEPIEGDMTVFPSGRYCQVCAELLERDGDEFLFMEGKWALAV